MSVAVFHVLFERFCLLFHAPVLQVAALFADHDGSVFLVFAQAFVFEQATLADVPRAFRQKAGFARRLFLQTASVGILSCVSGAAVFPVDIEVFQDEPAFEVAGAPMKRSDLRSR
jgi:hypothetical protein